MFGQRKAAQSLQGATRRAPGSSELQPHFWATKPSASGRSGLKRNPREAFTRSLKSSCRGGG